jgi:hypothetical protein
MPPSDPPPSDSATDSVTDSPALAAWLTIDEAAVAYGVTTRTIWRRLARAQLEGRRLHTPAGVEWRIRPPAASGAASRATAPPQPAAAPDQALLPLVAVDRLLAPYVQERDALKAEIAALQAARLEDARQIGRLEERLAQLASQSDNVADPVTDTHTLRHRRRWPWQR